MFVDFYEKFLRKLIRFMRHMMPSSFNGSLCSLRLFYCIFYWRCVVVTRKVSHIFFFQIFRRFWEFQKSGNFENNSSFELRMDHRSADSAIYSSLCRRTNERIYPYNGFYKWKMIFLKYNNIIETYFFTITFKCFAKSFQFITFVLFFDVTFYALRVLDEMVNESMSKESHLITTRLMKNIYYNKSFSIL